MATIEEGHGLKDISCPHGSRWIWWENPLEMKGMWQQVVWAPECECGDPPDPEVPVEAKKVEK